ncbi:hypothetical protein IVA95_32390 [Bradyrhizobium sp. 157]|uniref:hypothetical protein n=1 Tax=Bradyrhizobium sp. 157 TaxID=2782631 RepID=UPI001FFB9CBB|nr:hypothetical protein [Bradyrhizobium sp. 157]MCK1642126.1 hypothetical protein [Bradyrhizobium sp. 157]
MKSLLSIIAAAALVFAFSPEVKAQQPTSGATKSAAGTWQPKKASYGKRMRTNCGARGKMSGAC